MDNDGINDREQVETLEDNVELQIEYLSRKFGARIVNVHVPNIEISSSEILRRIRDGRSVKYYLPDSVIDYITRAIDDKILQIFSYISYLIIT